MAVVIRDESAREAAEGGAMEGGDARQFYAQMRRRVCIYNPEGDRVPLHTLGQGRAAFLVCGGPSLKELDLGLLKRRGVVTMGVNNSPAAMAAAGLALPNYWVCVDRAANFVEQIWKDASCLKFCPYGHSESRIRARNPRGELIDSSYRVRDLPSVFFYNRTNRFVPETFLTEEAFNWGNSPKVTDAKGNAGTRSVFYVALKLLYYFGFKDVYLLGCDFKMTEGGQNYAFEQSRSRSSVNGNNDTYRVLNARLAMLKPYLGAAGFNVFNCYKESGLTVFPYIDFATAIERATREVTEKPIMTAGMYEAQTVKAAPPSVAEPEEIEPPMIEESAEEALVEERLPQTPAPVKPKTPGPQRAADIEEIQWKTP